MPRRFAYFYLMKNEPDRIREAAPAHVQYWRRHRPDGYLGGPFEDHSGGLIIFEAGSLEEATALMTHDPFVVQDVLEARWMKAWRVE